MRTHSGAKRFASHSLIQDVKTPYIKKTGKLYDIYAALRSRNPDTVSTNDASLKLLQLPITSHIQARPLKQSGFSIEPCHPSNKFFLLHSTAIVLKTHKNRSHERPVQSLSIHRCFRTDGLHCFRPGHKLVE